MAKKKNNKKDFISKISSMTDTQLNNFIKENGKPPKKVVLVRRVVKTSPEE